MANEIPIVETENGERPPVDLTSLIMDYEAGAMSREQEASFFQQLIDSGLAWRLQGAYGRQAQFLIDTGVCHTAKSDAPLDAPTVDVLAAPTIEELIDTEGGGDADDCLFGDLVSIDEAELRAEALEAEIREEQATLQDLKDDVAFEREILNEVTNEYQGALAERNYVESLIDGEVEQLERVEEAIIEAEDDIVANEIYSDPNALGAGEGVDFEDEDEDEGREGYFAG